MNWVDILFLAFVAIMWLLGMVRGFIYELFGVISIWGAIFLAAILGPKLGVTLSRTVPGERLPEFLGYVLIFGAVYLVSEIIAVILKQVIMGIHLQRYDRRLGGLLGLLKGVAVCLVILFALVTYPIDPPSGDVKASFFARNFLHFAQAPISAFFESEGDAIKAFLDDKAETLRGKYDDVEAKALGREPEAGATGSNDAADLRPAPTNSAATPVERGRRVRAPAR